MANVTATAVIWYHYTLTHSAIYLAIFFFFFNSNVDVFGSACNHLTAFNIMEVLVPPVNVLTAQDFLNLFNWAKYADIISTLDVHLF